MKTIESKEYLSLDSARPPMWIEVMVVVAEKRLLVLLLLLLLPRWTRSPMNLLLQL